MSNLSLIIIAAIVIAVIIVVLIAISIKKRGGQEAGSDTQVYVGNIPYRVKDFELKKYFAQFGEVRQARIVRNSRTGRSKGFAFVTFHSTKDAQKALSAHGQDLRGRSMVVRIAKPPRSRA